MTNDHEYQASGDSWWSALGWNALLWALGTAACAGPLLSSLWNPFRSSLFFPMLILVAVVGGLTGPLVSQRLQPWLSPSLLFAAVYPAGMALGSMIAYLQIGTMSAGGAFGIFLLGALASAVPIGMRLSASKPSQALRYAGTAWLALSLFALSRVGLGVFGCVEALGYMLASRSAPDEQDV